MYVRTDRLPSQLAKKPRLTRLRDSKPCMYRPSLSLMLPRRRSRSAWSQRAGLAGEGPEPPLVVRTGRALANADDATRRASDEAPASHAVNELESQLEAWSKESNPFPREVAAALTVFFGSVPNNVAAMEDFLRGLEDSLLDTSPPRGSFVHIQSAISHLNRRTGPFRGKPGWRALNASFVAALDAAIAGGVDEAADVAAFRKLAEALAGPRTLAAAVAASWHKLNGSAQTALRRITVDDSRAERLVMSYGDCQAVSDRFCGSKHLAFNDQPQIGSCVSPEPDVINGHVNRVLVISGESGSGKTQLALNLGASAVPQPVTIAILRGQVQERFRALVSPQANDARELDSDAAALAAREADKAAREADKPARNRAALDALESCVSELVLPMGPIKQCSTTRVHVVVDEVGTSAELVRGLLADPVGVAKRVSQVCLVAASNVQIVLVGTGVDGTTTQVGSLPANYLHYKMSALTSMWKAIVNSTVPARDAGSRRLRHLLGVEEGEPCSHPLTHLVALTCENNRCAAVFCCACNALPVRMAARVVPSNELLLRLVASSLDTAMRAYFALNGFNQLPQPSMQLAEALAIVQWRLRTLPAWAWDWYGGRLGALVDNAESRPNPSDPQGPAVLRLRTGVSRYDASVAMTGLLCGTLGILPINMTCYEAEVAACRYLALQALISAAGHRLSAPAPDATYTEALSLQRSGGNCEREQVARALERCADAGPIAGVVMRAALKWRLAPTAAFDKATRHFADHPAAPYVGSVDALLEEATADVVRELTLWHHLVARTYAVAVVNGNQAPFADVVLLAPKRVTLLQVKFYRTQTPLTPIDVLEEFKKMECPIMGDPRRWVSLDKSFRAAVEEASTKKPRASAPAAALAAPTAQPPSSEAVTPFLKRLCATADGAPVRVSRVVLQLLHDKKESEAASHRCLYSEGAEDAHWFTVPVGADPAAANCGPVLRPRGVFSGVGPTTLAATLGVLPETLP